MVMLKVMRGEKPDRPPAGFSDGLWNLLLAAWDAEHGSQPPKRPSIRRISNQMKEDASNWHKFIVPLPRPRVEEEELCAYPTHLTTWRDLLSCFL